MDLREQSVSICKIYIYIYTMQIFFIRGKLLPVRTKFSYTYYTKFLDHMPFKSVAKKPNDLYNFLHKQYTIYVPLATCSPVIFCLVIRPHKTLSKIFLLVSISTKACTYNAVRRYIELVYLQPFCYIAFSWYYYYYYNTIIVLNYKYIILF